MDCWCRSKRWANVQMDARNPTCCLPMSYEDYNFTAFKSAGILLHKVIQDIEIFDEFFR